MHPSTINLSILIITLNEEKHLNELLIDLDFANEIIIIDSYSSDNTEKICKSFSTVKFIQNKFENFSKQRNLAISQAKNDWILFLDADERISTKLKSEIIKTLNSSNKSSAYLIHRTFMFKNKKMHFSGWQNDKIFRLFDKRKCSYDSDRLVHEKLKVEGKTTILKNILIHYSYFDFNSYKNKMKTYGVLKAREKYNNGLKSTIFMILFHPLYTFLYNYIIRLGFLDGKKGVIICYLNAYSIYIRYKELKKITSKI